MYHEIFLLNLKYVILILRPLGSGIYGFQEVSGREDFDSTTKILQFQDIILCHWVIFFLLLILNSMYIISLAFHGQIELQFDSQMDPSQVSRGIFSAT